MKTVSLFILPLFAYFQTAAIAAPGSLICVSNEKSGTVTLINGENHEVVATIPVGKRPRGIHTSPDGKLLFVALSGSPINGPRHGSVGDDDTPKKADHAADGIGVIDLAQKKFLRKLPAGSDPEQFAVSPDGAKLYIANEDAGGLTVLSVADGRLGPTLPVAEEPEGVAFTPDGKFVYVTCETTGIITVVDPAELKILQEVRLPQNSRPMCVAMAPGGKALYVSTGWAGTVCELNTSTAQVARTIKVGPRPWGLALSPDGRELYTANGPSNDISVVDLAQGKEIARIPVGKSPWGVAVAALPSN